MSVPISQSRPRVVFIAGKDPRNELGGSHSLYVRAFALAAIRAGYEPHLFSVGPTSSVSETEYGIIHRLATPWKPHRQVMIPMHAQTLAAGVIDFLEENPSVRLIHGFGVWSYAATLVRARLRQRSPGLRFLLSSYATYEDESESNVAGLLPTDSWRVRLAYRLQLLGVKAFVRHLEAKAYRQADVVLVNYRNVQRLIEKRFGAGIPCRMISYTAEAFLSSERVAASPKAPSVPPLVVSISRHEPRKGVDLLLHALARLRRENVPFRAALLGLGRLLDDHRALLQRLGLEDVVEITGYVPDALPYLERADLFVLPSRHEQSGSLSLIEALHAGKAIVASDCDGIPEDVTDGEDARLVRAGDIDALTAGLRALLTDADLRARLGRNASATFAARFSPETFTRELAQVYAEQLADGMPSPV